jgi:UDP-N-acetylglucosamine 4,6-dehydratase
MFRGVSEFLVTGGTGFLGQIVINKLLEIDSSFHIVSLSRSWDRKKAWKKSLQESNYIDFIHGDVANQSDVKRAFNQLDNPNETIVIHTAAYKEVGSAELNAQALYKTNIAGTENVLLEAENSGVKKLVFVSTDKAVECVNAYGATKKICESMVVNHRGRTETSVVRYGNVWASTGSVGDIWYDIVHNGDGVLHVHDPNMTRFWLTKDDAWNIVLFAATKGDNGTIYVPIVGSTTIQDIANAFKDVYGEKVKDVVYTHPVEGEKMLEKMVIPTESVYMHEGYMAINPIYGNKGASYSSENCERIPPGLIRQMIVENDPFLKD